MGLRARLTLLITAVFLLVLAVGTALAVQAARRAVEEDVATTARLVLQLLEAASVGTTADHSPLPGLLERLAALEQTRHMTIEVGGVAGMSGLGGPVASPRELRAPRWFVRIVEPEPFAISETFAMPGLPPGEIVVHADPGDEIEEAWLETRALLVLIVGSALLANGLTFLAIGRALRPLDGILAGLASIAQGDYHERLARPDLPELGRVVDKVNQIAASLEASSEHTRVLTQRNIAIQEEERRHLAHELHDEMGQSISAIKAVAVSIEQRSGGLAPQVAASARTIAEISTHVYDTVRGMMHRLRPAIIDELGLVPAVEQLVDDWNARHIDTFCALTAGPDLGAPGEATAITVYRVVQEALTNVARHAHAPRVDVVLQRGTDGRLHLRIADDGAGFDPARAPRGLGLRGMAERVGALGGQFDLQSQPGAGTRIAIDLPLTAS